MSNRCAWSRQPYLAPRGAELDPTGDEVHEMRPAIGHVAATPHQLPNERIEVEPAFLIATDPLKQTRPSVVTPSGVSAPVALGSRNQDLPHPFPH